MKIIKKSPIFYMGNKERLIKKGLLELFPKDIDTLIEPFCGSGVVSMNVEANYYLLNDNDKDVISLLNIFNDNTKEEIINHITGRIKEFGLNEISTNNKTKDGVSDEVRDFYKGKYNRFREFYNINTNKNPLDLYTLTYYSHCNLMRFSGKGNFNAPMANDLRKFNVSFGNQRYTKTHDMKIENGCNFFSGENVTLKNGDYKETLDDLSEYDFVYCDPPYTNTTAVYNEKTGWGVEQDHILFEKLDKLTEKGVKFGMSNVYENKGNINQHLIDWVEEKGYNVHFFSDFSYTSMGKGNAKTVEVYIYNY